MIESMAIEQMKLVAGFFILHPSHFILRKLPAALCLPPAQPLSASLNADIKNRYLRQPRRGRVGNLPTRGATQ